MDFLGFYRFRDNWHTIGWVSRFLCWIGRHDYEAEDVIYSEAGDIARDVKLFCFYCGHRKISGPVREWSEYIINQTCCDREEYSARQADA